MPKLIVVGGDFKKQAQGFFNKRFFSLPAKDNRNFGESIKISEMNFFNLASIELAKFYNLQENIAELRLNTPKDHVLVMIRFNDKRNLLCQVESKYFKTLNQLYLQKEDLKETA